MAVAKFVFFECRPSRALALGKRQARLTLSALNFITAKKSRVVKRGV